MVEPSPTNKTRSGTVQFMDQREKDGQLRSSANYPRKFAGKSYFIALTVSSGDRFAGTCSPGTWVVQWRQVTASGWLWSRRTWRYACHGRSGEQSVGQTAVYRSPCCWTCQSWRWGLGGGPVVDHGFALLIGNATKFFGFIDPRSPILANLGAEVGQSLSREC